MAASVDDKLANAPRLSIVVLPFENLSGDKDQDYFADGISEDLTTRSPASRWELRHRPQHGFHLLSKPVDAKQIGRELGVKYILEGSVRRVGETITINAQLISTETGAHVWADRFEGERSKLGELQVEAVSRLANSLGVELVKAEALRAMRERPKNPDAVDLSMRGTAALNGTESLASTNEAIGLFERAHSLDANNVQALIGLSVALASRATDFAADSDDQASRFSWPPRVSRGTGGRLTIPLLAIHSLSDASSSSAHLAAKSFVLSRRSTSGALRRRRRKRRSLTIETTQGPMQCSASIKCFSATPRMGSRTSRRAAWLRPARPET